MGLGIDSVTMDCADPALVGRFWAEALGWVVADVDDEWAEVKRPGSSDRLIFLVVPEGKAVKNRLHLDLRPTGSMAEEVGRMTAIGASAFRYVEENGSFWTVMQDPEGNEFCVLRGPQDGWSPDEL